MEIQQPANLKTLSPFVENEAEIDKKTLLERCTGKVSYSLLQFIRMMTFHRAFKDRNGNVIFA